MRCTHFAKRQQHTTLFKRGHATATQMMESWLQIAAAVASHKPDLAISYADNIAGAYNERLGEIIKRLNQ